MTDNNQQVNEQVGLLSCPFCGGEARVESEFRASRAIECGDCGANVGAVDLALGVEIWNRRAAIGQQACKGDISQSAPPADRAQSRKAAAASAGDVGDGAAMLAEIFNRLTQEQKLSVPQVIAGRIGEYMVRNGYRIVFGRWYLQAEADRAAVKGTADRDGEA